MTNRLSASSNNGERPRGIAFRDRRIAPPLALSSLPRLTARLALARPLTRTDILRRATLEADLGR
jgi:hypothetical protein